MAMAPVVYALWNRVLRFDPKNPLWPNRDRFVLSMGHASTLIYSILHLTGVTAVDEKQARNRRRQEDTRIAEDDDRSPRDAAV